MLYTLYIGPGCIGLQNERVYRLITNMPMPMTSVPLEALADRVQSYEAAATVLVRITALGCYWGGEQHQKIWSDSLERLANFQPESGNSVLLHLRRYPALLQLYAGGLAALAKGNYQNLRQLFLEAQVRNDQNNEESVIRQLYPVGVLDNNIAQNTLVVDGQKQHTPVSNRVHSVLREPLRELIARDDSYDTLFDRLEYLLALKYLDLERDTAMPWAPIGRFSWRDRSRKIFTRLLEEANDSGSAWPPVAVRLFDSPTRFTAVHTMFREKILPHVRGFF